MSGFLFGEQASDATKQSHGSASAEMGFAMGSLIGAWKASSPAVRDLFALALVRRCVTVALQGEGYSFTSEQFHYWLAGAAVLDAGRPPLARPARLVCDLVLGVLARSRCEEVARAAAQFEQMAMPIVDQGEYGDIVQCHEALEAAHEIALRSRYAGGPGPSGVVERLASAASLARASSALATRVAEDRPFNLQGRWAMVRDEPERAALWTLDLEVGGLLADALPVMPPLPCPGLFDRAWLRTDNEPAGDMGLVSVRLASALGEMALLMDKALSADRARGQAANECSAKSRLPQLLGILSVMEQLRSSQIEAALGVTRIGVRGIVDSGTQLGLVRMRKGRGLNMIVLDQARRHNPPLPSRRARSQPTSQEVSAVAEVDDALAFADKVLGRLGGKSSPDGDFGDETADFDDEAPGWA